MEYVESTLEGQHFPLDEKKAVAIITDVAEGLRYAHEQGIVHRDIKPGNIMIAPDGTAKITDWGLSKAQGTKQSGLIGFSLEYAAPEQLAPNLYGEPGPWTDIYQMGVLFYEMLAGHVPFAGDGMGEITHAILHDEPVMALSGSRHADAINAIIAKCLRKRPQDRYASVAELLKDLNTLNRTE
jgi:serine/threonine protein kinase